MSKKNQKNQRRDFIKKSGAALAGISIVPSNVMAGFGYTAPSDKLNIAGIGVGGMGRRNLSNMNAENIVALADVDWKYAQRCFGDYPKAKKYKDYRKMLDEMGSEIDAVMISTPDHTHYVSAADSMRAGKHVYVQKPLTHSVYESRKLRELAKETGVATQMGNQGNSSDDMRKVCEWIWNGEIGEVTKVDAWTNRPIWPQGLERPAETPSLPPTLDWDLFIGPAEWRPYHPSYTPWNWRAWWDFGTGALGDMACHIMDPAFKALKLKYPSSVEASTVVQWAKMWNRQDYPASCPQASMIHFDFPARGEMPPVTLHWYDGGLMPRRPIELKDDEPMGNWDGGVLFEGDDGKLMCDTYGAKPRLLPSERMSYFKQPEPVLERVTVSHQRNWVEAIKNGTPCSSSFDYAGPFTETVLMGNLALRSMIVKDGDSYPGRKRLLWDGENMRITNFEAANQFVKRNYREGWNFEL